MDTEFGTDRTKRVTLDVNQVIDPTLSVRTGGLFQDANVAGRDYVDRQSLGRVRRPTKYTPTNDIKITTNYIHTDLSGCPISACPTTSRATSPVTSAGIPRGNWYGFLNRDFQTARQDFGTGHARVQGQRGHHAQQQGARRAFAAELYRHAAAEPDDDQLQSAALDHDGECAEPLPERGRVGQPERGHVQARHRRGQAHRGVRRRIFEREHLDRPLLGPRLGTGRRRLTSSGAVTGVNLYFASVHLLALRNTPSLAGNPTRYGVNTSSVYVMDTANWQDTIIVNGGVRYDGYNHETSTNAAYLKQNAELVNYNVGLVYKPMSIGSIYAAYATSANPFGSELDATGTDYGGIPANTAISARAGAQQGSRTRHQMGAGRSPSAGQRRAVPDHEGQCARNRQRPADFGRCLHIPRASISRPRARSPITGVSSAAWC